MLFLLGLGSSQLSVNDVSDDGGEAVINLLISCWSRVDCNGFQHHVHLGVHPGKLTASNARENDRLRSLFLRCLLLLLLLLRGQMYPRELEEKPPSVFKLNKKNPKTNGWRSDKE